jgi:hypothetical protein
MSNRVKACGLAAVIVLCTSFSAWGGSLEVLQEHVNDFSTDIAKTLPFNASAGLNWSDAYIGKFFPSMPPHFGVGGSIGLTTMKMDAIEDLSKYLGYGDIPFEFDRIMLPVYTAEARLGGLFLPFDIGVKYGVLPEVGLWGSSTRMNYTLMGADLRYAVLDGKSNALLPNISIGVGFNYLSGGIGGTGGTQTFDYTYNGTTANVTVTNPGVDLYWETKALDFKVQVSKSILVITPYVGIGAGYAWSKAGYRLSADSIAATNAQFDDFVKENGLVLDGSELSSEVGASGFNLRAFGGLSVNLLVFRLDLTGMFNFLDQNYGASLGFRLQL